MNTVRITIDHKMRHAIEWEDLIGLLQYYNRSGDVTSELISDLHWHDYLFDDTKLCNLNRVGRRLAVIPVDYTQFDLIAV